MIYFVADVSDADGSFCVVPGSHKSNMAPPPGFAGANPDDDPTMLGLEVKAGPCCSMPLCFSLSWCGLYHVWTSHVTCEEYSPAHSRAPTLAVCNWSGQVL